MPIDKQKLYGQFQQSHDRRERLADTITRKALDIPMDDDVNITTTNHGSSPLVTSLATVGMLATGGTLAIGTAAMMGALATPNLPPKQPSPQVLPPSEYRITFWNEEGSELPVNTPRRPAASADNLLDAAKGR